MRTSLYTILCIVIRLGAISLAMSALGGLLSVMATLHSVAAKGEVWIPLASTGLMLLAAFLLWTWPGVLARLAAGRSSGQVFESPIAAEQIQWIAFSVLGVWLFVEGLASLCYFALQRAMASGVYDYAPDADELIQTGAFWLIQMLFGIGLVLGARGLTGILQRVRDGALRGGPPPVPDDGDPSAERP